MSTSDRSGPRDRESDNDGGARVPAAPDGGESDEHAIIHRGGLKQSRPVAKPGLTDERPDSGEGSDPDEHAHDAETQHPGPNPRP